MLEGNLVLGLIVAIVTAFVAGLIAQRIGLPIIVGYVLAGVAIGPFTPGPSVGPGAIEALAEIGVAFLMFAVGAEFSRQELARFRRLVLVGGTTQIMLTMALGVAIAPALQASVRQGLFLGALLALSSTVVAVKVLMARGELQSLHGRVALGLLIAQDIAVVPMVVILPRLSSGDIELSNLAMTAVQAAGLVAGAYVVGVRAVPWILSDVAVPRSRELFILGVVALALGTAGIAQIIGLSLAFGAFIAGLVIAESEYRTQVVAEVLPLRDVFASLFFVSVGMLINPAGLLVQPAGVALISAAAIIGKFIIVTAVVLALGLAGGDRKSAQARSKNYSEKIAMRTWTGGPVLARNGIWLP